MDYIKPQVAVIKPFEQAEENCNKSVTKANSESFDTSNFDLGGYPIRGTVATTGTTASNVTNSILVPNQVYVYVPREGPLIYQPNWNHLADNKYNQKEIEEKDK